MQSSRIQSKITFTTDREFRDYCREHVMRPDTEWEILSTGECGIGPWHASGTARRLEEARRPAGKAFGDGDWFLSRLLHFTIPKQLSDELARRKEDSLNPDFANELLRKWVDSSAGDLLLCRRKRAKELCDSIRSFRDSLLDEMHGNRISLLKVLETKSAGFFGRIILPSQCSDRFAGSAAAAKRFMETHVNPELLANTDIRIERSQNAFDSTAEDNLRIESGRMFRARRNGDGETSKCLCTVRMSEEADSSVFVHEFAHCILRSNPAAYEACKAFFRQRTKGEPFVRLDRRFPGFFRSDEYGKLDLFFDPYCGKCYRCMPNPDGKRIEYDSPEEILSNGLQLLYVAPDLFHYIDPEYFKLVVFLLGMGDR